MSGTQLKFRWRGDEASKLAKKVIMQALTDQANNILLEAVNEAPIDTGALRQSGKVVQSPSEVAVYISFGNKTVNYAIIQHETPYFKHPRGGKWKYLEDPFKRNKDSAAESIKLRVLYELEKAR